MKVATVVGTRPEIIRLSRVIPALDKAFEHTLIHTGQNYDYELNKVFFDGLGLRVPDTSLACALHHTLRANTALETIGTMLDRIDSQLRLFAPDAVLILGDTNSCLAAAYAAKRLHIPLFHMEAGNRCYDDRVPEEINRRMIDHISDINMPYTAIARENLLREGIVTDRIIKTGSPMQEVLTHYAQKIEMSDVVQRYELKHHEYYLVSCHREENIDVPERLQHFLRILETLAASTGRRILVSTHPRLTQKLGGYEPPRLMEFCKPFGFFDYVKLQMCARTVLSDSGTITEEASLLNLRALNLRETHERPEGMEEGSVMLTGFSLPRIMAGLKILEKQGLADNIVPYDYCVPNVSRKVVRILLSYVDVVNRNVWRKNV